MAHGVARSTIMPLRIITKVMLVAQIASVQAHYAPSRPHKTGRGDREVIEGALAGLLFTAGVIQLNKLDKIDKVTSQSPADRHNGSGDSSDRFVS